MAAGTALMAARGRRVTPREEPPLSPRQQREENQFQKNRAFGPGAFPPDLYRGQPNPERLAAIERARRSYRSGSSRPHAIPGVIPGHGRYGGWRNMPTTV